MCLVVLLVLEVFHVFVSGLWMFVNGFCCFLVRFRCSLGPVVSCKFLNDGECQCFCLKHLRVV